MSCSGRKSKSNNFSKEDLVNMAIKKGYSKSKALKSTKSELCNYLEIDKKSQSDSKKKSPIKLSSPKKTSRPCGMRKSKKFPDAYTKTELVDELVSQGIISRSYGNKHTINELCNILNKSPKRFSPIKENSPKKLSPEKTSPQNNVRKLPKFLLDMLKNKPKIKKQPIAIIKEKTPKKYELTPPKVISEKKLSEKKSPIKNSRLKEESQLNYYSDDDDDFYDDDYQGITFEGDLSQPLDIYDSDSD